MPLLDIRNLSIEFATPHGRVKVVDRVTLILSEGEICGLVGESGSGKSLIAKTLCGVIEENCIITADCMRFNNIDLLQLSRHQRRKIIGHNLSMIFQQPQSCLDPAARIGRQLTQAIPHWTCKGPWYRRFWFWRKARAIELLHWAGIRNHKTVMRCFPWQLTEGECQKVMIAIALANQPRLLIADEPTNAMEPATKAQIFRLLSRLNQNNRMTILLISHDLHTISHCADRLDVIYCGQIVESGHSQQVIAAPRHPYTQALIRAIPNLLNPLPLKSKLNTLPGAIPPSDHLPIGCRLGPRCPYAQRKCIETPLLRGDKRHRFACHFPLNMQELA